MSRSILKILAFVLIAAVSAQAQQPNSRDLFNEMATADVGERASQLLSGIQGTVGDLERYPDLLMTASGEDSLVLRLQIFEVQERGLADVHALADALLELEEESEQAELRSQVDAAYARITPGLWDLVAELRNGVNEFRARRQTTALEQDSEGRDDT